MNTEKRIYWTTSHSSDRYVIYVDGKVYADHLTADEVYKVWKIVKGIQ